MDYDSFLVRPISQAEAEELAKEHPHNNTLPRGAKYHMRLEIDGHVMGMANFGYGADPDGTPSRLFNDYSSMEDYVELVKFFVKNEQVPKNTASKFMAICIRQIDKHLDRDYIYTTATGYQGMVGTIYQAANFDYIGSKTCIPYLYLPTVAEHGVLVHSRSLQWRWDGIAPFGNFDWDRLEDKFGSEIYAWSGDIYEYIYWLCDDDTKADYLSYANFTIQEEKPSKSDINVWIEDRHGNRTDMDAERARKTPMYSLPTGET